MRLQKPSTLAALALATLAACVQPPDPPEALAEQAPRAASRALEHDALVPTLEAQALPEQEAELCDSEDEVPVPDLRRYATWQQFPLRHAEHGIDGTLRVLQDSRFTAPGFVRAGTHPILRPCDALPGLLEILDAAGTPVATMKVGKQTDVTAYPFGPGQTLYQVTELVRCVASCWCGDHVSFHRVVDGRFAVLSTERPDGRSAPVHGVTRGCYEGGGVVKADGQWVVRIHRSGGFATGALDADERHTWDGSAWRGTVVERKRP